MEKIKKIAIKNRFFLGIWLRLFFSFFQAQPFASEYIVLARLVPRCSDPSIEVRQLSMDCIQVTLKIALRCEGNKSDHLFNVPIYK